MKNMNLVAPIAEPCDFLPIVLSWLGSIKRTEEKDI